MVQGTIVHEEKLVSKAGILLLLIISVIIIWVLLSLYLSGSLSPGAEGILIFTFGTLVFSMLNFTVLRVILTTEYLELRFGLFKKVIPYGEMEECWLDTTPASKYGGIGIRIVKINGTRRKAYIVEGSPRVAIRVKDQKYPIFVFSTRNPENVINILNQKISLFQ